MAEKDQQAALLKEIQTRFDRKLKESEISSPGILEGTGGPGGGDETGRDRRSPDAGEKDFRDDGKPDPDPEKRAMRTQSDHWSLMT